MKFSELPLGQQFEWQGEHYSKISPLMARQLGSGEQKFIARAARVRLAAQAYHAETGRVLESLADHLPPEVLEQAKRALGQAFMRLLAEIEKPDSSKSEPIP